MPRTHWVKTDLSRQPSASKCSAREANNMYCNPGVCAWAWHGVIGHWHVLSLPSPAESWRWDVAATSSIRAVLETSRPIAHVACALVVCEGQISTAQCKVPTSHASASVKICTSFWVHLLWGRSDRKRNAQGGHTLNAFPKRRYHTKRRLYMNYLAHDALTKTHTWSAARPQWTDGLRGCEQPRNHRRETVGRFRRVLCAQEQMAPSMRPRDQRLSQTSRWNDLPASRFPYRAVKNMLHRSFSPWRRSDEDLLMYTAKQNLHGKYAHLIGSGS